MKRSCFAFVLAVLQLIILSALTAAAQNSTSTQRTAAAAQSDETQYQIEELVVTATKVETPAKEVGNSITVITRQQIEEQQKSTVLELLRTVPSLDIVQGGGRGSATSVFMRGAKSEHTLVLMDGVEMNDPVTSGRSFDFADMTTDNIERIEILRGPQSTLYGSDAIGGVVNIITKTGKGTPKGFFSVEGGSFASFREAGGISGGNSAIRYSLGFSREDVDGISAAGDKYGNVEKDSYGNTSVSGKLGLTPIPNLDINVIFRRVDAENEMDNIGGAGGDDANSSSNATRHFLRAETRLSLFHNTWDQKIGFSLTDHDRGYRNDVDAQHPDDSDLSSYNGRMYKIDWQNNFNIHRTNVLTIGVETEEEIGESTYHSESAWGPYTSTFKEKNARTTGYYLQDQVKLGGAWFTTLGVRLDDHTRFGTEATYRIASAYVFEQIGTKIKGSYGTGLKAPSLYQLYSSYGDQNLKPEESDGWDIGVEQSFLDERLTFDAAYFKNDFENLVDFNSATYRYSNVAKAKTQGVEISAAFHAGESVILRGSYTYTDAKDKVTGLDLLRRAKNKIGFATNYRFSEKGNINFDLIWVGKRADIDYSSYPASRVDTPEYALANLAASYRLTKHFQIFGRVNNLLNRDYEEVVGYGTPGVSAFGGIKMSF
jgi:vitamin B12 transporter